MSGWSLCRSSFGILAESVIKNRKPGFDYRVSFGLAQPWMVTACPGESRNFIFVLVLEWKGFLY